MFNKSKMIEKLREMDRKAFQEDYDRFAAELSRLQHEMHKWASGTEPIDPSEIHRVLHGKS